MARRTLLVLGLVATLALAGVADAQAGRVYVNQQVYDGAPSTGKWVVKPRLMAWGAGGGKFMRKLRWVGWGERRPHARGTLYKRTCVPNCASGGFKTRRIEVELYKRGRYRGRAVYECIRTRVRQGDWNANCLVRTRGRAG